MKVHAKALFPRLTHLSFAAALPSLTFSLRSASRRCISDLEHSWFSVLRWHRNTTGREFEELLLQNGHVHVQNRLYISWMEEGCCIAAVHAHTPFSTCIRHLFFWGGTVRSYMSSFIRDFSADEVMRDAFLETSAAKRCKAGRGSHRPRRPANRHLK